VLTTDEVYGQVLTPAFGQHGCPWGWVGLVDVSDETKPKLAGQFKLPENEASYCASAAGKDPQNTYFTSYASHNPTLVGDLAFVTWHSDGLRAISIADAASPSQVGVFMPEPLGSVLTEDPALSLGTSKVVAWSYPIIKNGLIYFIDLRNGLYVVRYTGPHADLVQSVHFLEGNSNLGDGGLAPTEVLGARRNLLNATTRHSADRLPSTGAGDFAPAGVAFVAAALALARRMKRRAL
jgi:hypothetical protein